MKKAIFFESYEGRLHRCIFAGLDNNNRPQWVMLDQGDEMMTLQDYMEECGLNSEDMRVLCLDGETLESTTLALVLGAVMQGYPVDHAKALSEAITNLRKMGIEWKQEKLQLDVHVHEYYEEANKRDEYRFYISCKGYGCIMEMDNFFTMKGLMCAVRSYFNALETEAGIGLKKELWSFDTDIKEKMDDEDKKIFDAIS